jgi:diguanylate cyclase (GGDEF)-like protein
MKAALNRLGRLRFGSLKVRIAVLYAALFASVLAVIMAIVSEGIERFGEDRASDDLTAHARVFDEIMELRTSQMRGAADVLGRDFGFREALATRDVPTIESALRNLATRSDSEVAIAVTLDGEMVSSVADGLPDAMDLWDPLDEGREGGVVRLGEHYALAAVAPIKAPDLIGWLVLAQPLNQAEMANLTELAAVDLSASVVSANVLPADLVGAPLGEVFERHDGERFLYRQTELPALQNGVEPRLVLRHSLSGALASYAILNYLLAGLSVIGLGLVVALSWRVARSITFPISKLDDATRAIAAGEDVSLTPQTDDEVGRLATSFNMMVDAIEERERKIVHVGLHDGLTGLPNRVLFSEQLDSALRRRKDDDRLLVAYLDLDDFKVINDTLGHPAGDELLRQAGAMLSRCLPDATIARLGGDEFAILMTGIAPDADLAAIGERVLECFNRPLEVDGQQVCNSTSIGIAVAPGDGELGTTLMKNADLALYRAKRDGKSTYHFFEPSLDEQARKRRQMELDLRLAIRDGQFELHFQPLYSLKEDRLTGFEALIRWLHPERGMISPGEFIPLAEETGLIVQIGEWVLHEACSHAREWPNDLSVAVNVSPKQFASTALSSKVLQALSSSGLSPNRLELEITESIFIKDVEKTLNILHGLRDLGVRIALDDFGTGYSSLSYLRSFPFDKLKIDRSFVTDLSQGQNAHAVIRAITTLADALGMDTLAEGVEEQAQMDVLRAEGCRNVQGFYLSRPLPATELAGLIVDLLGNPTAAGSARAARN